ncbi:MAG: hypothetical protein LC798_05580 [Chloroflexi bacterium]|nr:hypothetical protein [Chloroflexota bacterium]
MTVIVNRRPWPVEIVDPSDPEATYTVGPAPDTVDVPPELAENLLQQEANWGRSKGGGPPERPKDGSPKAKWVEFATAMGVADAEALTRDELVARFPHPVEPVADEQVEIEPPDGDEQEDN